MNYPAIVNVDLVLDANSVRYVKRQCELHKSCAWYGVPREAHGACIQHGLVEGEHFSHEPSPFGPPVGEVTYRGGTWQERAIR